MGRLPSVGLAAAVVIGLAGLTACSQDEPDDPPVTASPADEGEEGDEDEEPTSEPATSGATEKSGQGTGRPTVVGEAATGLMAPWGVAFLPDGSALVTERDSTRLLHLTGSGRKWRVEEVAEIGDAVPEGEGGLLGVAVSPAYDDDQRIFLYVSTAEDNRVLRATFDGTRLGDPEVILDGIPQGFIHDGGRLAFGPDDYLYVSTGESGDPPLAQDEESLGGKILRIDADGEPAPDNPGDSAVLTLGHRNVQGLAFDDQDRLWASEFGEQTWDELNLIEAGNNYGWPDVEGEGGGSDFTNPEVVWSTAEASPSGLAYLDGHLWLGALRGERLWRIEVTDGKASKPKDFFLGDYGRIRTVVAAPDGMLWVTTSNQDGRGEPGPDDDRILIVDPG